MYSNEFIDELLGDGDDRISRERRILKAICDRCNVDASVTFSPIGGVPLEIGGPDEVITMNADGIKIVRVKMPEIEKVIFNAPATIVKWKDGTKTVVKCGRGELWDPEKGLAMAICKRIMGNKGNYNEVFKKWLDGRRSTTRADIIYEHETEKARLAEERRNARKKPKKTEAEAKPNSDILMEAIKRVEGNADGAKG